jgi:hypothetical protein
MGPGGFTADRAHEIRREYGRRYAQATNLQKRHLLDQLTVRFRVSRSALQELLRGKSWW